MLKFISLQLKKRMTVERRTEKTTEWLVWKGCRRKSLFSKKNMAAQLRFAKLHLNKPQDLWYNVIWTDETKVDVWP